jgi:hypothetical protein
MVILVLSHEMASVVVFVVKNGFRTSLLHQNVHRVVLHDTMVRNNHINKYLPDFNLV